jgi:prevent-host-death family protein
MKTVSIREAKNRFTEIAREVEAGARITVTRNGKPVVEMRPLEQTGGIDLEAGAAYLRSKGIEPVTSWIAPDFDEPLPEDFLITPLPDPAVRKIG